MCKHNRNCARSVVRFLPTLRDVVLVLSDCESQLVAFDMTVKFVQLDFLQMSFAEAGHWHVVNETVFAWYKGHTWTYRSTSKTYVIHASSAELHYSVMYI